MYHSFCVIYTIYEFDIFSQAFAISELFPHLPIFVRLYICISIYIYRIDEMIFVSSFLLVSISDFLFLLLLLLLFASISLLSSTTTQSLTVRKTHTHKKLTKKKYFFPFPVALLRLFFFLFLLKSFFLVCRKSPFFSISQTNFKHS